MDVSTYRRVRDCVLGFVAELYTSLYRRPVPLPVSNRLRTFFPAQ